MNWKTIFRAQVSEWNLMIQVQHSPEGKWHWDAYRPAPDADGMEWLAGKAGYETPDGAKMVAEIWLGEYDHERRATAKEAEWPFTDADMEQNKRD